MASAISTGTSVAPVAVPTAAITPPVYKNPQYSVSEVVLTFFKEQVKNLAKAGSYIAFWTTEALPDLPKNVTKFNHTLRDFKNFISATEIPEKLYTVLGSASTLATDLADRVNGAASATWEKVGTASRKVFKDTMSLIGSTADGIDFTSLFVPISKDTLRWISGINFAATIGFAGNGVIEQVQNLSGMDKINPKRTSLYLLNGARDVSYLALGVIGFTSFVTATPLVPWVIVACLTSGLSFTIGSYFYEKTADPENKGKNLNPAIVVENLVKQRNYEQRLAQAAAATI
jgi:hypothetical protein